MLVDHQTGTRKGRQGGVYCIQTAINVTIEGHKHLGAALGSRSFLEEYVGEKVDEWVSEVT